MAADGGWALVMPNIRDHHCSCHARTSTAEQQASRAEPACLCRTSMRSTFRRACRHRMRHVAGSTDACSAPLSLRRIRGKACHMK